MGRLVLTALLLAGIAVASGPDAHKLAYAPRAGDVNTTFTFKGRGWQPSRRVDASYFVSASATTAYRRFHFLAGSNGSFVFELTKPIGLVEAGVTSKMCFRQRDTSGKRPRVFRQCGNFYVVPPLAQFQPSSGEPGDLFLLVVSGFLAGRRLDGTLTLPTGASKAFAFKARKEDAFIAGGPFGPIFVRRGGAAIKFPFASDDPLGLYTVLVADPRAGSKARAVVVLAQ